MNNYLKTHPFAKIGVFAFLLIPFVILINAFSPPPELLPSAYSSTILALEFVNSNQEVSDILNPLSAQQIKDLDTINYIDFGFMLFYATLLVLFIQKLKSTTSSRLLGYLIWLPVAIFFFDLFENIQLLRLTEAYRTNPDPGTWPNVITRLQLFTWLKWGGLALCFAILSFQLPKDSRTFWVVGSAFFLPAFLLILAALMNTVMVKDVFAGSIFLTFFILVLYCFTYKQKT